MKLLLPFPHPGLHPLARLRASSLDPGSTALYALIVAVSWVSLAGVLLVTDSVKIHQGVDRWLHIGPALATLAATWLLIQTVFALHFARRYYMENTRGDVRCGRRRVRVAPQERREMAPPAPARRSAADPLR
jgi:uncharacterized membrane protein